MLLSAMVRYVRSVSSIGLSRCSHSSAHSFHTQTVKKPNRQIIRIAPNIASGQPMLCLRDIAFSDVAHKRTFDVRFGVVVTTVGI
jgi:hypothetical protein